MVAAVKEFRDDYDLIKVHRVFLVLRGVLFLPDTKEYRSRPLNVQGLFVSYFKTFPTFPFFPVFYGVNRRENFFFLL